MEEKDNRPVGKGSGFPMDEMGPGQGTEETFTGPLTERLVHKSWKARSEAYQELAKIFRLAEDEKADCFNEYGLI